MALPRHSLLVVALLFLLCSSTLAKTKISLQWAICDRDHQTVLHKLGMDHKKPYKIQNITYYDQSPPVYTSRGLAFRTKTKHNQPISMIKERFEKESEDVPCNADCIWSRYGNSVAYSCGLGYIGYNGTKWSDAQVAFAERRHKIQWDSLVPYGPYLDPKYKFRLEGHKASFDDVIAVVGTNTLHIMELEMNVAKLCSGDVYDKVTTYLKSRGVVLCKVQAGKTTRLFDALARSSTGRSSEQQTVLGDVE